MWKGLSIFLTVDFVLVLLWKLFTSPYVISKIILIILFISAVIVIRHVRNNKM